MAILTTAILIICETVYLAELFFKALSIQKYTWYPILHKYVDTLPSNTYRWVFPKLMPESWKGTIVLNIFQVVHKLDHIVHTVIA